MAVRIGLASRDGGRVDECLLASSVWWIYDIDDQVTLVDRREDVMGCEVGCQECREMILRELRDCDLLFACDCETEMASFLLARGKCIVETRASVEETVREVCRNSRQNISLDYYRRVQSTNQDYPMRANAW